MFANSFEDVEILDARCGARPDPKIANFRINP